MDETINEQIILTEDELNKIGKYIYDYDFYDDILENYEPFQFTKSYMGNNLTFSIEYAYTKDKNYVLYFNNNKLMLYNNLTELFNEVNTFENIFVYYNNTVITKSEYDAIMIELNDENMIKKNADDVKEIVKRLCKK
uniref:Uncharacterized protein n=1 Tax=viral metagenome TaxID=1070528 RepID=A0A6C0H772_9ZZZZ